MIRQSQDQLAQRILQIQAENISDQSHVPFGHHGVAGNRASQYSAHFKVSDVNKRRKGPDGYTYELEWSPDGSSAPITQAWLIRYQHASKEEGDGGKCLGPRMGP